MTKKYDPRMHTAEHVLNQTMIRRFGCGRSFSQHMNAGKSKCDYHFDHPVSDGEMRDVEDAANAVLLRQLDVMEYSLPRCEAEKVVSLSKLPSSIGPDASIRIVSVGDYDICPCIGEHVGNTKDVGVLRILSHEYTPSGNNAAGVLRVRFRLDTHE